MNAPALRALGTAGAALALAAHLAAGLDATQLALHNIGRGAREEDLLFRRRITGHYRAPARPARTVP